MTFPAMLLGPSVVGIVLTGASTEPAVYAMYFLECVAFALPPRKNNCGTRVYAAALWLVVAIIGMTIGKRLLQRELDYSGTGPG